MGSRIRKQILKTLTDHSDDYVSGEMICQSLGVSRTAIWKHIKELQGQGYGIDAVRNRGYKIHHVPDLVTAEEVSRGLRAARMGQDVVYFDELESTNSWASRIAEEGAPEGTLVIADQQLGGRGRRGRIWHSPAGSGIWMSLILRPGLSISKAPQITLVAAIAVAMVLREQFQVDAGIKWPNDILIGGKKCCGILTEMSAEWDQIRHIVLGIGINVNQRQEDFPAELQEVATSVRISAGRPFKRAELIQEILTQFEILYDRYVQEDGFSTLRDQWKKYSITLGQTITAQTGKGSDFRGRAIDIDEAGALIIETHDGQHVTVHAADILFS